MSIITMARLRPSLNKKYISCDNNSINVQDVKKDIMNRDKIINKEFIFNEVFDEFSTNDILYESFCNDIISNLTKKINSTFYVFGQTGTGKTYTIFGTKKTTGLLELILHHYKSNNINLKINCIQVYNNKCYDLFNKNAFITERECNKIIQFTNLTDMELDLHNVKDLISKMINDRYIGESSKNNQSSRSHIMIKLNLNGNYIKIIDLAGSEKARHCLNNDKISHNENCKINKDILILKECLRALKNNLNHIPYRGSKITKLLKESFERKEKTYILGTISPDRDNLNDSINTLNYIIDIKKLNKKKLNPIKNNNNLKKKLLNLIHKKFDLDFEFIKQQKIILDSLPLNKLTYKNNFKYLINDEINLLNEIKKINL